MSFALASIVRLTVSFFSSVMFVAFRSCAVEALADGVLYGRFRPYGRTVEVANRARRVIVENLPMELSGSAQVAAASAMIIRSRAPGHADVADLIEAVQQEYIIRYGGRDETPFDQAEFTAPAGVMFVGYLDGFPVASGGWRRRPDLAGHHVGDATAQCPAELKRMYVRPSVQRRGFARAMLAALETSAAAAGQDALLLETGEAQPEAIALYRSAGYQEVAPFGHYACAPDSRHFGRLLAP